MDHFKISIIGAGSSYTPELIEGLAKLKEQLPVSQLMLMDINPERLEVVAGFCRRYARHLELPVDIETTSDQRRAIDGAKYIISQIRVGGNAQRIQDEKIPLRYGIIGQETTGPGGMFKALRTIPAMLAIARDVEQINPQAWIINYANPTGLNAEAVLKHTKAKFVGLCSGALAPRYHVSHTLGVPPGAVHYAYFGLNHMNFAYQITVNGRLLTDEEFDQVADGFGAVDGGWIKAMRLIPSGYLRYYFHRGRAVQEARTKERTRGEQVQLLEKEVFQAYADPKQVTKPEALSRRGGGGYSEIALGVMNALYNNLDQVIITNTANRGAIRFLPEDAVVEIACAINASGIHPLHLPDIPRPVWGLVAAVKNYEQLVVEAAVTGSRDLALQALMAHPLVGDYDVAVPLLEEMLEANKAFLPQFFRQ